MNLLITMLIILEEFTTKISIHFKLNSFINYFIKNSIVKKKKIQLA